MGGKPKHKHIKEHQRAFDRTRAGRPPAANVRLSETPQAQVNRLQEAIRREVVRQHEAAFERERKRQQAPPLYERPEIAVNRARELLQRESQR